MTWLVTYNETLKQKVEKNVENENKNKNSNLDDGKDSLVSDFKDEPGKNSQTGFLFSDENFFFFQAETYQIKWLLNEPYSDKIE